MNGAEGNAEGKKGSVLELLLRRSRLFPLELSGHSLLTCLGYVRPETLGKYPLKQENLKLCDLFSAILALMTSC